MIWRCFVFSWRYDDADCILSVFWHGIKIIGWNQYLHHDLHGVDRIGEPHHDPPGYCFGKVGCDAGMHRGRYHSIARLCAICQPGEESYSRSCNGCSADDTGRIHDHAELLELYLAIFFTKDLMNRVLFTA